MAGRKVRTFNEVEVVENAVKTVAALDEKAKKKAKTIARLWSESYKDRYKPASKSRSKR
jgi:hypothetical protein